MRLLTLFCLLFCSQLYAKNSSIVFIENVGQFTDQNRNIRTDIDLAIHTDAMNAFISAGSIHYQFAKYEKIEMVNSKDDRVAHKPFPEASIAKVNTYRVDFELIGCNKNVVPIKDGKLEYYEHYYYPHLGEHGALAHSYSKVVYKDIYPNIDWVIYVNGRELEHDFIIRHGGDPADIKMRYNGATKTLIDGTGTLIIKTPLGEIKEHAPISYQQDGRSVPTSFIIKDNIVSFDLAPYHGVLRIDPYIEWATYYGGAEDDIGTALTLDALGNVYMAGCTFSSGVATVGAFDASYADSGDAYIVKFDSNGDRVWGTYYGGSATDRFLGVAYDNQGSIIACGTTDNATGITTVGSEQPNFSGPYSGNGDIYAGGGDMFIVKFDLDGNRDWCTYFGGTSTEGIFGMTCDQDGNVYLGGGTSSTSNVATPSAHQSSYGGGVSDAYLAKYNNDGHKIWCTYYGGLGLEDPASVSIAPDGSRVFICAATYSSNNIGTPGTYQPTKPLNRSGFVAAFDTSGSRLWGSYLGSSSNGGATFLDDVAANSDNEVIVTGFTSEISGITSSGCYQSTYGGSDNWGWGDALIAKFDNTGNLVWSTLFGGSGSEGGSNLITTDTTIYIVGATSSPNNISVDAYQQNYGGSNYAGLDGWIAKFNNSGFPIWSTYLGGQSAEWLYGIGLYGTTDVYVSGMGITFPTTPGAHKVNSSGLDAYLAKFHDFPTGISTVSSPETKFKLYPTVGNGALTIEGTGNNVVVSVTDISGQQVYSEQFKTTDIKFSRKIQLGGHLAQGMYIVTIVSGNSSYSERYILQ